jgi:hypothetical protein
MPFFDNIEFKDILVYILIIFILCKLYQKPNIVEGLDDDTVKRIIKPLTDEALQSIASMYDNENLVLPSLTIEGDLKVIGKTTTTDDITTTGNVTATGNGEFGDAFIGKSGHIGYATFSHKNNKNNRGAYAMLQDAVGNTFLNSASGKKIYMRNNNSATGEYTGAGGGTLTVPNLNVKGDSALTNTIITQRDGTTADALTIIPRKGYPYGERKTHFYYYNGNTYVRGGGSLVTGDSRGDKIPNAF